MAQLFSSIPISLQYVCNCLGAVHKERPHKIAKKMIPFSLSALVQAPCSCGHLINFEKSDIFAPKKCGRPHLKNPLSLCSKNVRTRQPLTLTADVFYGQSLIGNWFILFFAFSLLVSRITLKLLAYQNWERVEGLLHILFLEAVYHLTNTKIVSLRMLHENVSKKLDVNFNQPNLILPIIIRSI